MVKIGHTLDDVSVLIGVWFALVNLFDLGFGILHYREHLKVGTGYIHHTVYIWIVYFSITGNGGICSCRPFAPMLSIAFVEELPTFVLALGSINEKFRNDYLFGISFFILRVLYNTFLLGLAVYTQMDTPVCVLLFLTTVMHYYWFFLWFSKYCFVDNKNKNNENNENNENVFLFELKSE